MSASIIEMKILCELCCEHKHSKTIGSWFGLNACLKCRREKNAAAELRAKHNKGVE